MYTVYADDHLLYHPNLVDNGYPIFNAELTLEANKSGSFQFKMPVTNMMYNKLTKMSTIITVYDNAEEIFRGRILNDERDFNNTKLVYCEGELAFLLDSIVEPYEGTPTVQEFFTFLVNNHNAKVEAKKQFEVGTVNVLATTNINVNFTDYASTWNVFNSYLLDQYGGYIRVRVENGHRYLDYVASYGNTNSQVVAFGVNMLDMTQYISAEDIFTTLIPLGATYAVELDDDAVEIGQILKKETEPVKNKNGTANFVFSVEVIRNSKSKENGTTNITVNYYGKTVDGTVSWSGKDGTKLYADIQFDTGLPDPEDEEKTVKVEQKVALASGSLNTTEKKLVTWTGDVATKNIVVTGEFINQYTEKDDKPISNSMAVVVGLLEQKYLKTTISTVNDGKNYLESASAKSIFGNIMAVHEWPDVDDPTELKNLATEYLNNNIELAVKLELNAVDLHELNVAYEKFKIGDRVKVLSEPHGITDSNANNMFTVTKITLDLQSPENNVYSLGSEFKSLTETQITAAKDIKITNDMIQQVINDLGTVDDVVKEINELVNTIYDKYADVTTVINNLDAAYAEIDFANIGNAAIDNLFANQAVINTLNTNYLQANAANIKDATIDNLVAGVADIDGLNTRLATIDMANVQDASIQNLLARNAVAEYLSSQYATITNLQTNYLNATQIAANYLQANFANLDQANVNALFAKTVFTDALTARYADVEFTNIKNAAVNKILVNTGLYNSLTVQDNVIIGGVLNADTIAAGSLKADKLVVRGTDGIYYQLNVGKKNDGSISQSDWNALSQEDLQKSFHGENIIANTITAKQIAAGSITANELAVLNASDVTFQNGQSQTTMSGLISDVNGLSSSVTSISTKVDSSVKSYTYTYGYGTSATSHPADSAFTYTSMPAKSSGKYIWRKTVITKNNDSTSTAYEMIQGVDGTNGQPGTSITVSSIDYASSTSGTTTPTSGWQSTVPTVAEGSYLWTRTTFSDNTKAYTVAKQGEKGSQGIQGNPGTSVTVSSIKYQAGSSNTSPPTGTWSDNPVSVPQGQYLWTKTIYSNGSEAYSVARQGSNGQPGSNGVSITAAESLYYMKQQTEGLTEPPAKPTSEVNTSSDSPDVWSLTPATFIKGYAYFECMQIHYDNNTLSWSDVIEDVSLNDVHSEITSTKTLIDQTDEKIVAVATRVDAIDGENGALATMRSSIEANAAAIDLRQTSQQIDDKIKASEDALKKTISDTYITISKAGVDIGAAKTEVSNNVDKKYGSLATVFSVQSDGTYVYNGTGYNESTGTVTRDTSHYVKTDSNGMHVYVGGSEKTWATSEGTGTPSLSIGDSSSDTVRWQFRRNNGRLNISWHS